jgi:hypothetical protein
VPSQNLDLTLSVGNTLIWVLLIAIVAGWLTS